MCSPFLCGDEKRESCAQKTRWKGINIDWEGFFPPDFQCSFSLASNLCVVFTVQILSCVLQQQQYWWKDAECDEKGTLEASRKWESFLFTDFRLLYNRKKNVCSNKWIYFFCVLLTRSRERSSVKNESNKFPSFSHFFLLQYHYDFSPDCEYVMDFLFSSSPEKFTVLCTLKLTLRATWHKRATIAKSSSTFLLQINYFLAIVSSQLSRMRS